jgi:N-methylhydantoinase B
MAEKASIDKIRALDNRQTSEIDPVTMAILSRRFDTVTTKMANTLLRTGRSGVVNLARDF